MLLFDIEHIIHLLKNYITMENYFFLIIALVLIAAFFLVRRFRYPVLSTCTKGNLSFEAPTFILGQQFTVVSSSVYNNGHGLAAGMANFTPTLGATSFYQSEITKPPYPFGTGQVMRMNNTSLNFDLERATTTAQFEYLDQSETINLGVKGSGGMYIGNMSSMPTVQTINGVTIKKSNVKDILNPQGVKVAEKGTITLYYSSDIGEMLIGGQALFLDNFCFN